jgi:N-methylhydantoinase B
MYAVGGVLRHCEFRPTTGTLSVASHPAPVSCGPPAGVINALSQSHRLLSKMTRSSEELNKEAYVGGAASTWPVATVYGINQWGHPVGTIMMDTMIGGLGAFTTRDGVTAGGNDWTPICSGPNIESNEQFFPLLFLYRKIRPDTGGAGRYRGGNTLSSAYVVHGSDQLGLDTASTGQGVPTGAGIFGGYPGAGNSHRYVGDSDLASNWFARGALPSDISEIGGKSVHLAGKSKGSILKAGSAVFEQTPAGGPGVGDPLDRPSEEVQLDIANGEVTIGHAAAVYGVVVDAGNLELDEVATASRRQALLKARLQGGRRWIDSNPDANKKTSRVTGKSSRTESLRIHEHLEIRCASGKSEICCTRCDHHVCASNENYKWHSVYHESPLTAVSPRMLDPKTFVDDEMVFRQYFCPKCAVLFENEIARKYDPPLWDIRIS